MAAALIVVGLMVIVMLLAYLFVLSPALKESREEMGVADEEAAPEPEPEAAPAPAEPLNWQPVLYGAGGLAGLLAVGGSGFFIVKGVGALRARKDIRDQAAAMYNTIAERHQDVLVKYSSYETDLWKALNYPALHDVEVETTSDFLSAMRDAESVKKATQDKKQSLTEDLRTKYEHAVSHLESAFTAAENKAIRLGESSLSESEQKDIRTARSLLAHAEDSGNSAELRATYYSQLKRVINRLNEAHRTPLIPQQSFTEIEHQSRLMLTDGSTGGTGVSDPLLPQSIFTSTEQDSTEQQKVG